MNLLGITTTCTGIRVRPFGPPELTRTLLDSDNRSFIQIYKY